MKRLIIILLISISSLSCSDKEDDSDGDCSPGVDFKFTTEDKPENLQAHLIDENGDTLKYNFIKKRNYLGNEVYFVVFYAENLRFLLYEQDPVNAVLIRGFNFVKEPYKLDGSEEPGCGSHYIADMGVIVGEDTICHSCLDKTWTIDPQF